MKSPGAGAQLHIEFAETVAQIGEFASNLQAGVLVEDTARVVLGCNERLCELLGIEISASALIGADSAEVIGAASKLCSDSQTFVRRTEEILAARQFVSSEVVELCDTTLERDYLPIYLGSELTGHLWQYRDVTDRMQALRRLEESEARFAALVDSAPMSIHVASIETGAIRAGNQGLTRLTGFALAEVIGRTSQELGVSIEPSARERALEPVRKGQTTRSFQASIRTKSGEIRDVELAVAPLVWEGEQCYITATLDVTDQKRAAAELQAAQLRFEAMFQSAPLAIALSKLADGTFIDVNPAFTSLLGYTREDVIGRTSIEIGFFVNPETRAPFAERIAGEGTRRGANVSVRTRDGVERELELSASVIELNGEQCLLTIADDITEKNMARVALAESEAINHSILDALPDLMFRLRIDGTILDYRSGHGFQPRSARDEVIGRTLQEILPREGVEQLMNSVAKALTHQDVAMHEYEVMANGEKQAREVRCVAYAPDEVVAIVRDITRRKRAEEGLRESEARFRLLAENAHDIIFRYQVAEPGGMEYISSSVTRIAGYLPDDYYADPDLPRKVIHPDDREAFDRMIIDRTTGPVELRWLRKDGSVLWAEQTNVLVTDDDGTLIAIEGVVRDITTRRDAESSLRESEERFRLLAENAHDIIFRYRLTEPRATEYMSPSVTRIAGYLPEEYYADPDFSLKIVHPDDRELLGSMATLTGPQTFRLRWLRKDGAVVWADQTMVPIFGEDGALIAVEGVGRDITATVEAEEALQRARDELEGKVERAMVTKNVYGLTFREFTVLHHIVTGETDKVIAAALGISPLTVHKHVASILAKMQASSRTEAGVRALREGLLDSQASSP